MSDRRKFWSIMKNHHDVIILVHEKPDGDCLGSALSLCLALKSIGKAPLLFLPEPLPVVYNFLPGQKMIRFQETGRLPEDILTVAVDCADRQRIQYELNQSNLLINIDHHISNELFGHLNIVNTAAAAAGEILYKMFAEGGISITPEIATCLYVAITTDTGSFTYSNTTSKTFQIAGKLVDLQADVEKIRFNLYEKRPLKELLVTKAAFDRLRISKNGRIISCALSYDVLSQDNLLSAETDGLIGMLRSTEGVELVMLFKETEPQVIKVSFRSKAYVDVNKLAAEFSGGGHPRAAGCTVRGYLEETLEKVLQKAQSYIEGEDKNGWGY